MNMEARRLVKPVYKRQQFLLSFIKELNEPLSSTDFQKLLFYYITNNNLSYYDFVPYLFGCYSLQAAEDVSTLQSMGWLENKNDKIQYAASNISSGFNLPFEEFGVIALEQLPKVRGNRLVRLAYEQYPYYAINSKIANSIMDNEVLARIKAEKEKLKNTNQVLFTIGYEGISIEQYLNMLIKNNIQVLCDVRNNPLSRKFGFSKSNLQKYLNNIGIEYVHFPELGIRSEKRNNINSDDDYIKLFFDFKKSLQKQKCYLDKLYELLTTRKRIALTCFEHEPSHCHRHVIRDYLTENYKIKTTDL